MTELTVTENGLSLDLPEEFYTLDGLLLFEGQLDIATADRAEAMTRFAYHVHQILERELWKLHVDDAGEQVYYTQDEYLGERQARWRAGVSTMKELHTTMRMARAMGYSSVREILDQGGVYLFNEVRRLVRIDSKSGEVTGLKAGTPPNGMTPAEWAKETIIQVSENHNGEQLLMPRDVKRTLQQNLVIGKPEIEFVRDRMVPLGDLEWIFTRPGDTEDEEDTVLSGVIRIKFEMDGNGMIPDVVRQEFYRKVGVIG